MEMLQPNLENEIFFSLESSAGQNKQLELGIEGPTPRPKDRSWDSEQIGDDH